MYAPPRKLILASGIALAMGVMSGMVAAATDQEITDARQETQIWTTYALSPYLRANDLKVSVHNGKATLTGVVEEEVNKELAKEIALGVHGITAVDNQIAVKADFTPKPSAEPGYGERIEDTSITTAIKSKLLWNRHTNGLSTKVETRRGRVTLSGTADSAAARDTAGRLAMSTRGVVSVSNQLVIDSSKSNAVDSAKSSMSKAEEEISDSWITTKVKSTLLYSSNVAGSDIAVSTQGGIVTLSGKVNNGAERDLAVELAQHVRGVKSVDAKALTF
ncbi:BON domain-containing protein [Azotobacter beijerinckii]|uniref:Osmotically-inducible protein Y n=1 Tax=Azotobacter beijerinckii TaxID=170623 RepID=A0A1I4G8J8_9GAMM|nr:BON domain-containing protein [Azotobacter beijerinckii]SFB55322.1 Osmotically-inducible protein OsmY, contains BON domain [Azotobacter beijerinckii]SFL26304.1 Osmotically-inducible protein OsmY, contains BON domain [Azotobacter beijerinckii]